MNGHEMDVGGLPGTMLLSDMTTKDIILQPTPSGSPQDPLNWPTWRKALNFSLVLFYVLITFVLIDILGVAFSAYAEEWGMTFDDYNTINAMSYAGLALGCVFFIPFVYKFGRRPVYLVSIAIQFATAVWSAKANGVTEMIPMSLIQGLGGAISETIVQITIADLFFVHQYATMNGFYLLAQSIGAFLGPVAAGYVVDSQGWRWQWWWCAIFLGLSLVLVFFFFEETAFVARTDGQTHRLEAGFQADLSEEKKGAAEMPSVDEKTTTTTTTNTTSTTSRKQSDTKTWTERLGLYSKSEGPVLHHAWQPFVLLVRVPAVLYVTLTFGALLANFAAIIAVCSGFLFYDPYDFDATAVGLFNIAPFVGAFLGSVISGPLSDRLSLHLAKKNNGVYESEMRLWPAIPFAIFACAGTLMFGIGIAQSQSWILLAVGSGAFGFGFIGSSDIALAYLTDSYQKLIGDAFIAVIFVRNAIAVMILFTLTPWINAMGLQYMFVLLALLTLLITAGFPAVLLVFGKRIRQWTFPVFEKFSQRQPGRRQ